MNPYIEIVEQRLPDILNKFSQLRPEIYRTLNAHCLEIFGKGMYVGSYVTNGQCVPLEELVGFPIQPTEEEYKAAGNIMYNFSMLGRDIAIMARTSAYRVEGNLPNFKDTLDFVAQRLGCPSEQVDEIMSHFIECTKTGSA